LALEKSFLSKKSYLAPGLGLTKVIAMIVTNLVKPKIALELTVAGFPPSCSSHVHSGKIDRR
jgi:hypothetical protein